MNIAHRPWWGRTAAAATASALAISLLSVTPTMAAEEPEPAPADEANVLIFTKTTQFRHEEAIVQGTPVLEAAFAEAGITSDWTEDSSVFNDEDLAQYDALVMFQASGDPWNAEEKAALERYQQAGGGIVAIHNATDMRGEYEWWDEMIGALMPGHAATGSSPGLPGTVRVEDQVHPSTEHLPQRWDRADEWYNFSANVRGDAHVLATMDETTYEPGGNAMGYDHPISWCKAYDGGRAWMTGMGHFGAHYTEEPAFVQHILGGVQWAAGVAEGDCGGTDWDQFERVALDQNTSAPFAMDVAPDGRVFFTELVRGQIRVYDPNTQVTSTAITIPVYSGGEDGLLGIALSPDFAENGHVFVYHSKQSADNRDPENFISTLSRFTVGDGSIIDPASEEIILEVPARREPDEPGHTGGGLIFDNDGNLLLGVGDDVNPHSEPSGGYAPISERDGTFHDARETSANTNDLRGKILRITPGAEGGYTIPEGNMFPEGTEGTLPEIYAMGFRNPFRFSVDPATGDIGMADYSPDNGSDNPANRGPAGIAEWNLIREPGFYGWPLCMGDNEPFRDVDFRTNPVTVGEFFDCDAPINDSVRNTGLTELPAAVPADVWYGYQRSSHPEIIPQGGGLAPMGGPFYDFDAELESDTKFPEYFDGNPFFYEWARNSMYNFILDEDRGVEKVNAFLPSEPFLAPIDSQFGPEGSMYVLDWGGGFGRDNPNSGLYRIDYVSGSRSPVAEITATPDSGQAPLEVSFDGTSSFDPEGDDLTYAWDFEGDGTVDSTEPTPTFTYTESGQYDARLTVTDTFDKTGTATATITVGNTRPEVDFTLPPTGSFFDFGDEITWDLSVVDAEDEEIDDADVVIQPALGHDEHAHPATEQRGRTGSVVTSLGGGHDADTNVFYVLDGRYTDNGGVDGAPALTGSDTSLLFPKKRQAEFLEESEGITVGPGRDIEGYNDAITGSGGAWASYTPFSLHNLDGLTLRVASTTGGDVELRRDAPDGELLGTAEVPSTGSLARYTDVDVALTDPGDSFDLYLVFPGEGERRVNFIEAIGKGSSPTTKPVVEITSPTPEDELEAGPVTVTAEATDGENTITGVEFFLDGESVGTDAEAPYEVEVDLADESRYQLTAVATNNLDVSTTSRIVVIEIGDLFGDWEQFTNTTTEFERPDSDTWIIDSGGANMWQGVDQYGSVFQPGAAGEEFTATVKIESQGNTNAGAKAGIIVRNDITSPGTSPGYTVIGIRPANGFEWLRDSDGNGTLDTSTSASSTSYPSWVRLTRDGEDYQAFWSKDGENFTPVGDPVQLPGAASVQDIGLFVTAHHGSNTSAVEFTGFELLDEVVSPEPEPGPDPAPICLAPGSDEFDGDALDTDLWTTVRQDDDLPITVADGGLNLPVVQGDIDGARTGPISYVGQPVPEGPWEISTRVTIDHDRHWQLAGLMLHASDDEYTKLTFTRNQNGSRYMEFVTETGGSRSWHQNVTVPEDTPSSVLLKLVSDGETITGQYSLDGQTWVDLEGSAQQKADATFGLTAAGDTDTPSQTAVFDYFALAADSEDDGQRTVSDEFDGAGLDGCRWDSIVRYDSNTVEMSDGELTITTQPGDINGDNPLEPRNFILQEVGDGDWTIETRLRPSMLHRWQLAGLLAYGDDDNYVKLDVLAQNASGTAPNLHAELVSEQNGGFGNGGNRNLDVADTTESGWYHLRMTRTGDQFEGWISNNGQNWTSLGDPVTNAGDLTKVGIMAIGPEQTEPVEIAFDWFRLAGEDDEEDTTAPEVTVSTDPAEPNGAAGWFTSDVAVSATATDDSEGPVLIEHRVDGGEWTEHTEPVVVSEDGTYLVEVRATDEAGNVSEVQSLEVSLDATDPTVEITGVSDGATVEQGTEATLEAVAQDATSGVDSVVLTLNGEEIDNPSTFVPPVGTHELVATATDVAGNSAEVTVTFEVTESEEVSFESARAAIEEMIAEGLVQRPVSNQLLTYLDSAHRLADRGDTRGAERSMDRFEATMNRVGDADVRAELAAIAQALRELL